MTSRRSAGPSAPLGPRRTSVIGDSRDPACLDDLPLKQSCEAIAFESRRDRTAAWGCSYTGGSVKVTLPIRARSNPPPMIVRWSPISSVSSRVRAGCVSTRMTFSARTGGRQDARRYGPKYQGPEPLGSGAGWPLLPGFCRVGPEERTADIGAGDFPHHYGV